MDRACTIVFPSSSSSSSPFSDIVARRPWLSSSSSPWRFLLIRYKYSAGITKSRPHLLFFFFFQFSISLLILLLREKKKKKKGNSIIRARRPTDLLHYLLPTFDFVKIGRAVKEGGYDREEGGGFTFISIYRSAIILSMPGTRQLLLLLLFYFGFLFGRKKKKRKNIFLK
jgi:hypothetical protein